MSILQEKSYQARALNLPLPPDSGYVHAVLYGACYVTIDALLTSKALFTRFLLPPLPLCWLDRLVGRRPVRGDGSKGCPFAYRPTRSLDFNNDTYTPSGEVGQREYVIENMGPRHITRGKTTKTPRYVGMKEGKII